MSFFLLALRLLLEVYFAVLLGVAGLAKSVNVQRFADTLTRQHLLPTWSIQPVARIVPWLELGTAFLLLTGLAAPGIAMILVTFCTGFLIVRFLLLYTGRDTDCGCYGNTAPEAVNASSVATSVLWLVLALLHFWLVIMAPGVHWLWRVIGPILFLGGILVLFHKSRQPAATLPALPPYSDLGGLDVGSHATPFTARDLSGTSVSVDFNAFQGQWILLFVSPGCPACPYGLAALEKLLEEEKSALSALVLAGGDLEVNRAYAREQQITAPVLTTTQELLDRYQIRLFPFFYVIEHQIIAARGPANSYELLQELMTLASISPTSSQAV